MQPIQAERLVKMNQDKLDPLYIGELKARLVHVEYEQAAEFFSDLKTPSTATILSVLLGSWAIDRFYIGDWLLGVLKIVTCGGCYIWWIVDWFIIGSATRKNNTQRVLSRLPEIPIKTYEDVAEVEEVIDNNQQEN